MGRRRKDSPPAIRVHRGKRQAYVEIDGKQRYLGPVGSREAAEAYRKIVNDWVKAHGVKPSSFAAPGIVSTIADLVAAHHAHAEQHYRRADGSQTEEVKAFVRSLSPVLEYHADRSPNDFRPTDLRAILEQWVAAGLARQTINKQLGRIRRVWEWGVSWDLVSSESAGALKMVRGLQSGRTAARDYEDVDPVPLRVLARTLKVLPEVVAAMVRTQYYCGARPGEVCRMRGDEVHKGSIRRGARSFPLPPDTWAFVPNQSKNDSKGKFTRYLIGPRLQRILSPRIAAAKGSFLFPGRKAECWRVDNYAQVVASVCVENGIPHWSPNQVRHSFLTRVDELTGSIELASTMVAHANVDTTAIYVQRDLRRAAELAAKIG